MIINKNTAKKTAEILLQINAIKLNPQDPFTWSSEWKSPIYCDNSVVFSFPPITALGLAITTALENGFSPASVP